MRATATFFRAVSLLPPGRETTRTHAYATRCDPHRTQTLRSEQTREDGMTGSGRILAWMSLRVIGGDGQPLSRHSHPPIRLWSITGHPPVDPPLLRSRYTHPGGTTGMAFAVRPAIELYRAILTAPDTTGSVFLSDNGDSNIKERV